MSEINEGGRLMTSALACELVALREAVATHLRYLDGEIVAGLREGRHTPEVAANIGRHQSRNLRRAVEITGKLSERDGTAGPSFRLPDKPSERCSFLDSASQEEIERLAAAEAEREAAPPVVSEEGPINITVVVSGAPVRVSAAARADFEDVIENALASLGMPRVALTTWTLRREDGSVVPLGKVCDADLAPDATLFLDPDAGGGASTQPEPTEGEPHAAD
jgi:hypothetical protein